MNTTMQNSANKTESLEKTAKPHPLKNKPFYGLPRNIALIAGLSDGLFRLLCILCASYGDDGWIEYKIATLASMLGKSIRQTKALIAEARLLGYIVTISTGRSLLFYLDDMFFEDGLKVVPQPEPQVEEVRETALQKCEIPHVSYKKQKKLLKEKVVARTPEKSPEPVPQNSVAAASHPTDLDPRVKACLKEQGYAANNYIRDAQNLFGVDYTVELIKIAVSKNSKNPIAYIRANINCGKKYESIVKIYEKPPVVDCRVNAIKEHQEYLKSHAPNIDKAEMIEIRKKILKPKLIQFPTAPKKPAPPKKTFNILMAKQAFIEELKCIDATGALVKLYDKKTDDKLMADNTFKNFCERKGFEIVRKE